jgi:hypothetical protein
MTVSGEDEMTGRERMRASMTRTKRYNSAALPQYYWQSFFELGTQYYVAARMLFFARGGAVTGILANHAVEMFLKGALCSQVSITDLKEKFSHSLPDLWDRSKTAKADATLADFDSVIEMLDEFSEVRYPDKVLPAESTMRGAPRSRATT